MENKGSELSRLLMSADKRACTHSLSVICRLKRDQNEVIIDIDFRIYQTRNESS